MLERPNMCYIFEKQEGSRKSNMTTDPDPTTTDPTKMAPTTTDPTTTNPMTVFI